MEIKLYFDKETGLLSFVKSGTGDTAGEVVFESYKEVDGIKFPHKVVTVLNGMPVSTTIFEQIVVNPEHIDNTNFLKPNERSEGVKE